jgi:hypothetical protein
MKTLYKYYLILLFPISASAQINTFYSAENHPLFNDYSDSIISFDSDTTQHLSVNSRLFSIGSVSKSDYSNTHLFGASLSSNLRDKIIFTSHFDYLIGNHNALINEYQDSLLVFPGFGREKSRLQYNLKYLVNKFITVDFGKGKHFIGNGYRSLLLSTEHSPYPYLKLTTKFGRVKYYNLYTTFLNPNMADYGRKKHSTVHFLDFEITKNIHFGVFEAVMWQSKSENVDKGFEFAYMNPIIFYRPVEFSMGSSKGNALMGANFNMTFGKTTLYAQALLDDLNISRQKDRDEDYEEGFFQNKYAYQLGLKTKIKGVNLLTEYNQTQPYTYGHRTILQNYSHMNQALAHPLGANFKELVFMADYKKDKWRYKLKLTTALVGLDSLNTHYGQNIFKSDHEASTGGQHSYGNFNGQGVLTTLSTMHAEVAYSLKWFDIFSSVYYKNKKSDLLDQTSLWYSVGIRTFPFSTFQDY